MSPTEINDNDFLLLRSKVDEVQREMQKKPLDKVLFPEVAGSDPSVETVAVNELFLTTLTAIAKATRKLRESDVAIDMSSNPIEIKFTGSIAGISKNEGEIYLKLNN